MKGLRKILNFGKLHESGLFYTNADCTKVFTSNKPIGVVQYICYSNIGKLEIKEEKSIITMKPDEVLEVVTTDNEKHFFKCTSIGYKGLRQRFIEVEY